MAAEQHPEISIIIPAYNEAARLGSTIAEVLDVITRSGWDAELIVVNDGSQDSTQAIAEQFAERDARVRVLNNGENRGKGYSVRSGILQARGNVVMFTDADLSAPMEEASRLLAAIADGADIAIGSRWLESSRQTIRQPWYRQIFGRCFNMVTRMVMGLPYADTQCGFKAFRRPVAQRIFSAQKIERWGFDPELLFLARKMGFKVREVPVSWAHDQRSKLSYLKDGLKMLEDLVRIRWFALRGEYRAAEA